MRRAENPQNQKTHKNNDKPTTTKIYMVPRLLNVTGKTEPTDFSRLCSKLMNNKSSYISHHGRFNQYKMLQCPLSILAGKPSRD